MSNRKYNIVETSLQGLSVNREVESYWVEIQMNEMNTTCTSRGIKLIQNDQSQTELTRKIL